MQIDDYADALVLWQGAESVQLREADSLEALLAIWRTIPA